MTPRSRTSTASTDAPRTQQEDHLKRSMKNVVAVSGVTALMAMAAPPAVAGTGDAAGCTTTYVNSIGGDYRLPDPPTVTYTPPATITVDADDTVNFTVAVATHVANATVAYVICLV